VREAETGEDVSVALLANRLRGPRDGNTAAHLRQIGLAPRVELLKSGRMAGFQRRTATTGRSTV
jgi:hypothetical protein